LNEILVDNYRIEEAEDGMDAISKLLNAVEKPHLILLDIMMPGMDGFGVLQFMKSDPTLGKIPVIFITAADEEQKGLSAGAVDYISKPFDSQIVKLRVANHLELNLYRERLEAMVEEKANQLVATKEKFMETMADLIEYRSLESGEHVKRTRELSRILVMYLLKNGGSYAKTLLEHDYGAMIKAVPLHDIGKVGIPDNILLKPGRLTPEEFLIMETHTTIGSVAIQSMIMEKDDPYLSHCYDICLHHHEKWNGAGYPEKLAEDEIPLSARIVALVDVYDALVSERVYKKGKSHEEATSIILESSGTHFDPNIVNAYENVQDQFRAMYGVTGPQGGPDNAEKV